MWLDLILVCVLIRRPRDWRWVHGLSWLVGDFDWIFLLTLNFKLNFWLFSIIWISLDFFLSKIAWNVFFFTQKGAHCFRTLLHNLYAIVCLSSLLLLLLLLDRSVQSICDTGFQCHHYSNEIPVCSIRIRCTHMISNYVYYSTEWNELKYVSLCMPMNYNQIFLNWVQIMTVFDFDLIFSEYYTIITKMVRFCRNIHWTFGPRMEHKWFCTNDKIEIKVVCEYSAKHDGIGRSTR